jgi:hypothetical protein
VPGVLSHSTSGVCGPENSGRTIDVGRRLRNIFRICSPWFLVGWMIWVQRLTGASGGVTRHLVSVHGALSRLQLAETAGSLTIGIVSRGADAKCRVDAHHS